MAASSLPLGVDALCVLVAERKKRDALEIYKGDLMWSLLSSVHALAGGRERIPSCSEMYEKIFEDSLSKKERAIAENRRVIQAAEDGIAQFLEE